MHHSLSPTDTDRLDPRRRPRAARAGGPGTVTALRMVPTPVRELQARLYALLERAGLR